MVGTGTGTKLIMTGDLILVGGTQGVVTVLKRATAAGHGAA